MEILRLRKQLNGRGPSALLDPYTIDESLFPEALSVAFFESRLFLKGHLKIQNN